jgi:predicted TIM-barrel fold metal-dependent hydrolase
LGGVLVPRPAHVDVHQHIWTPPLLDALSRRECLPFARITDGIARLHCAGEQAWAIDLEAETPERRAELARADGLDRVIIAPSSPIGLEALPRNEADELIEAHLEGIDELGSQFAAWGPVALDHPDPDDVDARIARGCVGIVIPAGALAGPDALPGPDALAGVEPLLARAEQLGAMVFVHPGPAPGQRRPRDPSLTEPLWWAALTDYVAQMQAAWLTFATVVRRHRPALRVLFAILAGGAPLHAERLAARGGPPLDLRDARTFYETSSYGTTAIEAIAKLVGAEQLVYGSDRPVIEPPRSEWDIRLQSNAARLITGTPAHRETIAA